MVQVGSIAEVWKTPPEERKYEHWAKLSIESNLDAERFRFCENLKFKVFGKGRNRESVGSCEFRTDYGCIACTHFGLEAAEGLLKTINVKV